jgi:hypothetical protein
MMDQSQKLSWAAFFRNDAGKRGPDQERAQGESQIPQESHGSL